MTVSLHPSRRVLHWTIAVLVLIQIPIGLIFTNFKYMKAIDATFGKDTFNTFYDVHKSTGLLILALMLARVAARLAWPNPAYSPPLPALYRRGGAVSHTLLYLLLLITPVIGWSAVSAYPAPVPFYGMFEMPALLGPDRKLSELLLVVHRNFAYVIIAVITVHICAGLFHRYIRRDTVFDRIRLRF